MPAIYLSDRYFLRAPSLRETFPFPIDLPPPSPLFPPPPQTEAPLLISPYLSDMTKSEIHTVMTGGFATIAGSVMGAFISFGVRWSMVKKMEKKKNPVNSKVIFLCLVCVVADRRFFSDRSVRHGRSVRLGHLQARLPRDGGESLQVGEEHSNLVRVRTRRRFDFLLSEFSLAWRLLVRKRPSSF